MIDGSVFIRKCPVCGKAFYCDNIDLWQYKRKIANGRNVVFCTWSCLRKWENSRRPLRSLKEVEDG